MTKKYPYSAAGDTGCIITGVLVVFALVVGYMCLFFAYLGFRGQVADASYELNRSIAVACIGCAVLAWLPATAWALARRWWKRRKK